MANDLKIAWDACGEAFDRFTSSQDSFSENIERPIVESLLGDVARTHVLDVGCGSGTYAALLARRGASVTGIDLSLTMLGMARRRTNSLSFAPDFAVADIAHPLPFCDEQFDLVFTATVLHYVADL